MSGNEAAAMLAGHGEGRAGAKARPPANDAFGGAEPGKGAPDVSIKATEPFRQSLSDAEKLLSHAAQAGRFPLEPVGAKESVKGWVIDGILNARAAVDSGKPVPKETATAFWAAFADLSRITSPVTAASLDLSSKSPIKLLKAFVVALSCFVIVFSIYISVKESIAKQVSQLIAEQNVAALKLWSQVHYVKSLEAAPNGAAPPASAAGGAAAAANERRAYAAAALPSSDTVVRVTPNELFTGVVDFSRKNNWLRETASQLNNWFNFGVRVHITPVVFNDDHPEGLNRINVRPQAINSTQDIIAEAYHQILVYQHIRNFSQAVQERTVISTAVVSNFLPAIYALLGATLYGFRHYARLVEQNAYTRSSANSARYFIALIAGTVVGLFGSLFLGDSPVPPLAIAFLVGYAVEAFFSRLDGFIGKFKGDEPAPRPAPAADIPAAKGSGAAA